MEKFVRIVGLFCIATAGIFAIKAYSISEDALWCTLGVLVGVYCGVDMLKMDVSDE